MARYNEKKMPYLTQDKLLDDFCEMIFNLETKGALLNFLKDLLNRQERQMLVRRLRIAEMLNLGYSYTDIRKRLHCGFSTIARVQRWLNFGRGGYKNVLRKK
ncbi:MAG: YerC/YecD family TrpR-related protein [Parcubacteria group bacterium]